MRIGGAAAGLLILVAALLAFWPRPPPAAATASAPAPAAAPAAGPTGAAVADSGAAALIGEWSGNGATCNDPLAIIVRGKAISEVMSGTKQSGSVTDVAGDGTVSVAWPDGAWTYKVAGDDLTLTPAGGAPMSYHRCAD